MYDFNIALKSFGIGEYLGDAFSNHIICYADELYITS